MSKRTQYQVEVDADTVIIDNSIMKEVMRCSLAAVLRYGLHLAPKLEGVALSQGQAGHAALAEWFDTGSLGKALRVYDREYAAIVAPAMEALPIGDKRAEVDRVRLDLDRTRAILQRWMEEHPLDSWALVVTPGETELPVSAPLMTLKDGRRVVFVALLDALARRRHGGRFSVDHKFRNSITDWWKEKQEDAAQFTGQLWLGREWDLKLAGVYVNAIELPNPRTGKSKCEHGVPWHECEAAAPGKHARHELIGPLTKSQHEIAAWRATLERRVRAWVKLRDAVASLEIVREGIETGVVPTEGRFNDACTFCGFRTWCRNRRPTNAPDDWFVSHVWNPLAERRTASATA